MKFFVSTACLLLLITANSCTKDEGATQAIDPRIKTLGTYTCQEKVITANPITRTYPATFSLSGANSTDVLATNMYSLGASTTFPLALTNTTKFSFNSTLNNYQIVGNGEYTTNTITLYYKAIPTSGTTDSVVAIYTK